MRFDYINKEFGANLKKRRNAMQLSQEKFGKKVNLSRASIANIERGEQGISLEQLFIFASALAINPDALLPEDSSNEIMAFPKQTRSFIESIIRGGENA